MASSGYLHGTHEEEQQRLSALNTIVNDASLREMRLQGRERVLDLGSGLGQLARAMARAVTPNGSVVAIEGSPEQLASAERYARMAGESGFVDFRHGDVHALPLTAHEWGSFDVAHTRFVLEHVSRPDLVVQQMVDAVRPGGRVIVQDTDHSMARFVNTSRTFDRLWLAYQDVYRFTGGNPYVGRDVPRLLLGAGAALCRSTLINYGGCAGTPEFEVSVDHLVEMIAGAAPRIVEHGLLSQNEANESVRELRAWGQRPDAAFWFPFVWVEAIRPATIQ